MHQWPSSHRWLCWKCSKLANLPTNWPAEPLLSYYKIGPMAVHSYRFEKDTCCMKSMICNTTRKNIYGYLTTFSKQLDPWTWIQSDRQVVALGPRKSSLQCRLFGLCTFYNAEYQFSQQPEDYYAGKTLVSSQTVCLLVFELFLELINLTLLNWV